MNNSDNATEYSKLLHEMELLKSENNKLIAKIEELTAYSGRQTLLTDKQTLLNLLVFLVEEAPFGVLVKKVKARSIVYYNKAVTELFQLNGARLLGTYWNNFFSSEWLRKIEMFDQECIQNNIIKTDKIQITTKEGETRSVLTIRHHPALLDTEDEKYIITFFVDITQNEQCKLDIASALEADKRKSEFLANMSHEIRSPL
ncbi:MAG: PAS domain S-box protein, partial [Parabacteroides sp.]|nr:PAS domain S-box protein [Parabacteroides sp.]